MKKLFKGTLPTIAILLVAVMSLTTFTYAWFTGGENATVDVVEVGVKDVDGLIISKNGYNGTWGSTMTPIFVGARNKLQDVSCNGVLVQAKAEGENPTISEATMNFFTAKYNSKYDSLDETKSASIDDGELSSWIQFDIWIKNEGEAKVVSFDPTNTKVTGDVLSTAIARIAFVQQGVSSASAKVNENASPVLNFGNYIDQDKHYEYTKLLGIWEPDWNKHTTDGETWLTHNNQAELAVDDPQSAATYYAVQAAVADGAILNVATGFNYVEEKTNAVELVPLEDEDTLYEDSDVKTPAAGGKYYVYTSEFDDDVGEHFRELKLEDFFKPVVLSKIIDANGKLKPRTGSTVDDHFDAEVFTKEESGYQLVTAGAVLDATENTVYYVKSTVGGSSNVDVKVYTREKCQVGEGASKVDALVSMAGRTETAVNNIKFDIAENQIIKLTVFIWLEGQDCDCTNYVAGSDFKVDIALNAKAKNETPTT